MTNSNVEYEIINDNIVSGWVSYYIMDMVNSSSSHELGIKYMTNVIKLNMLNLREHCANHNKKIIYSTKKIRTWGAYQYVLYQSDIVIEHNIVDDNVKYKVVKNCVNFTFNTYDFIEDLIAELPTTIQPKKEKKVMKELSQGTLVEFNYGGLQGTGTIVGLVHVYPIVGGTYIIAPHQNIVNETYKYTHFVCP